MSEKAKRVELARGDVIKCNALLAAHLHKIEGTDLWKFDEGWDDQRISDEVGGTAGPTKVSNLRLELYGKLQNRMLATAVDLGPIEERLHKLEHILERLHHHNAKTETVLTKEGLFVLDLADRFNRLIELLKMNHIVDARSLRVEIPK